MPLPSNERVNLEGTPAHYWREATFESIRAAMGRDDDGSPSLKGPHFSRANCPCLCRTRDLEAERAKDYDRVCLRCYTWTWDSDGWSIAAPDGPLATEESGRLVRLEREAYGEYLIVLAEKIAAEKAAERARSKAKREAKKAREAARVAAKLKARADRRDAKLALSGEQV